MTYNKLIKLTTGLSCLISSVCLFALAHRALTAVAALTAVTILLSGVIMLLEDRRGGFVSVCCLIVGGVTLLLSAFLAKAAFVAAGLALIVAALYQREYSRDAVRFFLYLATGVVMILEPFVLRRFFAYVLAVLLLLHAVYCFLRLFSEDFFD